MQPPQDVQKDKAKHHVRSTRGTCIKESEKTTGEDTSTAEENSAGITLNGDTDADANADADADRRRSSNTVEPGMELRFYQSTRLCSLFQIFALLSSGDVGLTSVLQQLYDGVALDDGLSDEDGVEGQFGGSGFK
ncbi:hypothetical protein PG996_007797 [Apiospora saccharicola]|uniref:Uncharacterized protein n=1 Tax=Apiospora saccharicola TaxID=335842 RepID=A0ABR1UW67_9PEZI